MATDQNYPLGSAFQAVHFHRETDREMEGEIWEGERKIKIEMEKWGFELASRARTLNKAWPCGLYIAFPCAATAHRGKVGGKERERKVREKGSISKGSKTER